MEKKRVIEILKLFNEKVDELSNSNYIRNWDSQEILWNSLTSQSPIELLLPNNEETKAFILTLRFFCQDNEPISLENISKIYQSDLISEDFKSEFHDQRNALNTYLDLDFRSNNLTNRDILEAFVYGNYAHSNQREQFLELTNSELKHHSNLASFYSITNSFCQFLIQIKKTNKRVLKNISAT